MLGVALYDRIKATQMHVALTDLDGRPIGRAELTRADERQLMVDGRPVVAIRIIGSRVALILAEGQVCVTTADYAQVRQGGVE